jgi:MFS family permease
MNKQLAISFALLIACLCFFSIDLPIFLRAVNPSVNYLIYSLFCFLVPISIISAGLSARASRKWLFVLSLVLAIAISIPTGFLGALAFDEALRIKRLGHDPSLQLIKDVADSEYRYRLYRTNCGATCAFGLELRKERNIPFGLKIVRPVWSFYGAEDGELSISESEIEIRHDGFVAKVKK